MMVLSKNTLVLSSNEFKDRYMNHQNSFNNITYEKETELSKYIWDLKRKQQRFRILKHITAYRSGSKRWNLCNEKKMQIMLANENSLLNRRSEIFAKCRHREKYLAGRFKCTREQKIAREQSVDHVVI